MDEKALKTSWKQRIIIIIVALLLLGSTVLAYVLIVLNNKGSNSSSNSSANSAEVAELQEQYEAKAAEIEAAAKPLSDKYFKDFSQYKSNAKAYNAETVNNAGLKTQDLKAGNGKTLAKDDTDYAAYYVGWCPDGSIFDSSFDDSDDPKSLKAPLDPSIGLIDGWNEGVIGMKLGGVRQIEMSGDLAYGDSQEICGTTGSPLKFIVMAIAKDEKLDKLNQEAEEIYLQLYQAYYNQQ